MFRFLFLLLISFNVQSATVIIDWAYTGQQDIASQNITVLGETLPLGAQVRSYTLSEQPAGDYTVSLAACNGLEECSDPPATAAYTIPDVPNASDLILNITVTKD